MIVTYSDQPPVYRIEFVKVNGVKNGKIKITFNDDIQTVSIVDEFETTHTNYTADVYSITWVPPPTFEKEGTTITTTVLNEDGSVNETATLANLEDYLAEDPDSIRGYAKDAYAYSR